MNGSKNQLKFRKYMYKIEKKKVANTYTQNTKNVYKKKETCLKLLSKVSSHERIDYNMSPPVYTYVVL